MRERAFIALEGGGAKGVAHVGALEVLLATYDCRGYAGTSAGSLAAALAAAGFTSKQVLDQKGRTTLLSSLDGVRHAMDLFDKSSQFKMKCALWLMRLKISVCLKCWMRLFIPVGSLLLLYTLVTPFVASVEVRLFLLSFLLFCGGFAFLGVFLLARFNGVGLANLDKFEESLAKLLSKKIFDQPSRTVTFADFGPLSGRPSLKMVATNLENGRLQLFSPETTPDVPVSQAVAASVCIPGVFIPRKISISGEGGAEGTYYDGGLVSNLPAWCFDHERLIDGEALTFVISVGNEHKTKPTTRIGWIKRFAWTAVFGASELNHRGIGRSIHIELITQDLETLDFDAKFDTVAKVISDNRDLVEQRIRNEKEIDTALTNGRDLFVELLEEKRAEQSARSAILEQTTFLSAERVPDRIENNSGTVLSSSGVSIRVRAAISDISELARTWQRCRMSDVSPDDETKFLAPEIPVVFHWQLGFQECTDTFMPISPRSGCGGALLQIIKGDFKPHILVFEGGDGRSSQYLYAAQDSRANLLVARDLAWIVILPISFKVANGHARHYLVPRQRPWHRFEVVI